MPVHRHPIPSISKVILIIFPVCFQQLYSSIRIEVPFKDDTNQCGDSGQQPESTEYFLLTVSKLTPHRQPGKETVSLSECAKVC